MTDQEINIAIAESMGWTDIQDSRKDIGQCARGRKRRDTYSWWAIPDYYNNLNAMHEVEHALESDQWDAYCDHLEKGDCPAYSAPARQRAEAYLKTINKWEEGE